MPISARLDAPGVLHHIIIRGIERRNIFRDNKDRDNFIDCSSDFGKNVSESRKAYLSYVKPGKKTRAYRRWFSTQSWWMVYGKEIAV